MCACALPTKAVSKMTYTVSGGTLNPTHSLSVKNETLQNLQLALVLYSKVWYSVLWSATLSWWWGFAPM